MTKPIIAWGVIGHDGTLWPGWLFPTSIKQDGIK